MTLKSLLQFSILTFWGTACQSGAEEPPAEGEPANLTPTEVIV